MTFTIPEFWLGYMAGIASLIVFAWLLNRFGKKSTPDGE